MSTKFLALELDNTIQQSLKKTFSDSKFFFGQLEATSFVEEATRRAPDLIFLDIDIPNLTGMEILARLSVEPKARDIPIVFLSSSDQTRSFLPKLEEVAKTSELERIRKLVESKLKLSRIEHSVRKAVVSIAPMYSSQGNRAAAADLTQDEAQVLMQTGFDTKAQIDYDPIAEYAVQYETLLASSLTVEQAAKRIGVSGSRIRQRLLSRPPDLYGVRISNSWRLPLFQFSESGLVPNIARIIKQLDTELDAVSVERWICSENIDLEIEGRNVSPRDWLLAGQNWKLLFELAENL